MNHCIRRITSSGNVSTIAGNPGEYGFANGRGSAALFWEPSGIAVTDTGVIYVADTGNHVIRRIENGNVTTVAGIVTPVEIPVEDEEDEEDEMDYRPGGYTDGPARSAMFNFPRGLCYADGVLFIADTGNHVMRALTVNGNVITVAGSGEPGDSDGAPEVAMMNKPTGSVYKNSFLYIADSLNNKIKMVYLDLGSLS